MKNWSVDLNKYNSIIQTLLLVGLILTGIQIYYENQREKRSVTLNLYDSWQQVMDKDHVRENVNYIGKNPNCALQIVKWDTKINDTSCQIKNRKKSELHRDAIAALNVIEKFAVAYEEGIGDRALIKRDSSENIRKHFMKLKPFADEYRKFIGDEKSWEVIYRLEENDWAEP